jgi:hypothetical protein
MDINEITNQIEAVISNVEDFGEREPDFGKIVNLWKIRKARFIELFGGEPIYEIPNSITIELNEEQKTQMFSKLLSQMSHEGADEKFIEFLEKNESSFYENRVSYPAEGTDMKEGAKLLKSFKYVLPPDSLRKCQDIASRVIQQNKVTGKLCFSVHPLDYITISQNNCGWSSCHYIEGDYRAGNFSYMLDSSTVVVYLKTEEDTHLKYFPEELEWNNKIWRMLIHITKSGKIIHYNKQYPFFSSVLMDEVRRNYPGPQQDDLECTGFSKIDNDSGTHFPQVPGFILNGFITSYDDIVEDKSDTLAYNDILACNNFNPYLSHARSITLLNYSREDRKATKEKLRVKVGSLVPCPCCDKTLDDSEHYICTSCAEAAQRFELGLDLCDNCKDEFYKEELIEFKGKKYCAECFFEMEELDREERGVQLCYWCGEEYDIEDMKMLDDEPHCPHCYEERMAKLND